MSSRGSDLVRQMRSALFRRGRRPGLRTAKSTLAAVLSFLVALLTDLDRMRVEIEAAVRQPEQAWRPPPVVESQRRALRQIITAARQSTERRRRRS